ncbi:hypothetical protein D3C76_598150 [compost metagenome]
MHIGVGQVDAENVTGLGLDHCPGRHAAIFTVAIIGSAELAIGAEIAVGNQAPRCNRVACRVEHVLAQEHLVRRVRAVGLALVHERRGGVGLAIVAGAEYAVGAGGTHCARQHHEVGRAARYEQRVVRLQRNVHDILTALGDQVQAVVEELAEEGHPRVETGSQADVRRLVGDEEHGFVVARAEHAIQAGADHRGCTAVRRHRGRVARGLVDDQVADNPWLRVAHRACPGVARLIRGRQQAQEGVVRGAKLALPGDQVVVAAVDGTQAEWHLTVGKQITEVGAVGMRFCDEDLLEDEFQVRLVEIGHFVLVLDLSGERHGTRKPSRAQSGAGLRGVLAKLSGESWREKGKAVPQHPECAPGISGMNGSLSD